MTFDQSTTAIERCRDLCAEFGFTVKQEASTHRVKSLQNEPTQAHINLKYF